MDDTVYFIQTYVYVRRGEDTSELSDMDEADSTGISLRNSVYPVAVGMVRASNPPAFSPSFCRDMFGHRDPLSIYDYCTVSTVPGIRWYFPTAASILNFVDRKL